MRLTLQPTSGIAEPKKLFAALWGILLKSRICWRKYRTEWQQKTLLRMMWSVSMCNRYENDVAIEITLTKWYLVTVYGHFDVVYTEDLFKAYFLSHFNLDGENQDERLKVLLNKIDDLFEKYECYYLIPPVSPVDDLSRDFFSIISIISFNLALPISFIFAMFFFHISFVSPGYDSIDLATSSTWSKCIIG